MLKDIWTLLTERTDFFAGLLLEHLEISLLAIAMAILAGGLAGILISEFQRAAKPALAVINFLYTIPSISMLGFLIPFSGVGNATAVIALTVYALCLWCAILTRESPILTRPFLRRPEEWAAHGSRSFSGSSCPLPCR